MDMLHLYKKILDIVCRFMKQGLILLLLSVAILPLSAQKDRIMKKSESGNSLNVSADRISEKLENDVADEDVADDYVTLAKELADKKDYVRAEDYLTRALNIYQKAKKKELTSYVSRELAKVQEIQNKIDEAIRSYQNAASFAIDDTQKKLNENDANRLKYPSDLVQQSAYIQSNIDLAQSSNSVTEQVAAHRQMAGVKMTQNDSQGALEELAKALEESQIYAETEDLSFSIKQEIANTLVTDKKHDAAIELNKELVDEARQKSNPEVEVKQLQNLATSYFEAGEASDGITSLQEAYNTAVEKGLTLEAKKVLEQMVRYYRQEHKTPQALGLYSDFIGRLDSLVKNDSTLIDEKFFKLQEEKIAQLEKERALKDELIAKKNRSNTILWISIAFIAFFLVVLVKILYDNIRKNKKIALQSLRREMNPHFIFNSLNSVNQFISENNELEANKYLSSYSKLMRTMMENSNNDFIPLSTELGQLREYLELEYMRFRDKFTYTINVDEALDADFLMIPNMLIQPQLENAVWHGLRYKEGAGVLLLTVREEGENVCVIVEDNGIGIKKSMELKTAHQKAHNSRGQTNSCERINLLNHLYNTQITMDITDKSGEESGVLVVFHFPRRNK